MNTKPFRGGTVNIHEGAGERANEGILRIEAPFVLECGAALRGLRVAYETSGSLNAARDNAVLVVHALTGGAHASSCMGSSREPGWWEGLIGAGKALDPARHFIICSNLLGSCYGTTGPAEMMNGRESGDGAFPTVTTRDMARAQKLLLGHFGVERAEMAIGGSLGAMVVWELSAQCPGLFRDIVPIAGGPRSSAWAIAFNAAARRAITDDAEWKDGRYEGGGPRRGLELARMIAMISYRSSGLFEERFSNRRRDTSPEMAWERGNLFEADSYLRHQGRKLAGRFDARSYMALTEAMDTHDIGRGRGGVDAAMRNISSEALVIGISSDLLFPKGEMEEAAARLKAAGGKARYAEIDSRYGHDAFLVEYEQLNGLVGEALERRTG